jgi:hypothetical protein
MNPAGDQTQDTFLPRLMSSQCGFMESDLDALQNDQNENFGFSIFFRSAP